MGRPVKPGERLKWRSLTNRSRWFYCKLYAVSGKYALVVDEKGIMYPHYVAVERLLLPGAVEIP
jgi:hypothetical protein